MLYLLLIFIIILFFNCKFNKNGFKDYLEIEQTNAIKGIFAIIIAFSHFNSYIVLSDNIGDKIYLKIFYLIGQLMVTLFLFYSGYGVYKSAFKKKDYINTFPKKRFLKTLIKFDLAVLLFFVVNLFLNNNYTIKDTLLAFTGWTSIGNSNWFMFAILYLYAITYISAKLTKNRINNNTILLILFFTTIYFILMKQLKDSWWYDTIFCYFFGMIYAKYEEKINKIIFNTKKYYFILLIVTILFLILFYFRRFIIIYEIASCVFCLLIVLITNRLKFVNPILSFLGKYSFEIYILQRIPYMILKNYLNYNIYLYFTFSILLTLLISICYKQITNKICKHC